MMSDVYNNYRISAIQKNNPDLWLFLDGVDSYANDTQDDLNCRRWQHTLKIAYFISDRNTNVFKCKPGEMTTEGFEEYRDHHGDEDIDFFLNRASRINIEEYEALKESNNDISENYKKSLLFEFTNVFYLKSRADILEEDFLVLKPIKHDSSYRHQIAVLAKVKGMEGYYLFEFNN